MNKTQLVEALAARIGDRRTAASVVDGLFETIVDTVRAGGAVSISGFGVFESRSRAARVARNPRTGEAVAVPATTVPAFRAGLAFRSAVGDGAQPSSRGTSGRRTRSAPAAVASPETEAEAVADAPAKIARGSAGVAAKGRGKAAADKPGRSGKRTSGPGPDQLQATAATAASNNAATVRTAAKKKKDTAAAATSTKAAGSSSKAAKDTVADTKAAKSSADKKAADKKAAGKVKSDSKPDSKKKKAGKGKKGKK
jgi:DNA-binding protein HU-beta